MLYKMLTRTDQFQSNALLHYSVRILESASLTPESFNLTDYPWELDKKHWDEADLHYSLQWGECGSTEYWIMLFVCALHS